MIVKNYINLTSISVSLLFAVVGVHALLTSHAAPSTKPDGITNTCSLSSLMVPSCGVLWGAYVPSYGLTTLENSVGRQFDFFQEYHDFPSPTSNQSGMIPNTNDLALMAGGRILLASWTNKDWTGANTYTWANIASGSYDSTIIIPQTQNIKAIAPTKIFLSFAPEMDGSGDSSLGTAADYVAAYQHIYNVFKAQGVTNVVWVWTPTGDTAHNIASYYPGDSYVDWLGYDPYNFYNADDDPACSSKDTTWKNPFTTFSNYYDWVQSGNLGTGAESKPMMLDEYGSHDDAGDPISGDTNWYSQVPAALAQLPNLHALSQYDSAGSCPTYVNSGADLAGFAAAGLNPIVTGQSSSNPPTTAITSPAASTVVQGHSVVIDATASATSPASITKVELLVNGNVEATDTTSPYDFTWNSQTSGIKNGTISVTTEAFDSTGLTTSSSILSLKLDNGDINGDGAVNIADLSILAAHWGDSGATLSEGDLNGDGVINIADLSILATNWGDSD